MLNKLKHTEKAEKARKIEKCRRFCIMSNFMGAIEKIKAIYFVFIFIVFSVSSDFFTLSAFAGNTNDIINQAIINRDQILKDNKEQVEEYKKISSQKMQGYQGLVDSIQKQDSNVNSKSLIKPAPQAIVFISFSMPSLSLQQIIQDASRYKIPVVMRGLYNNSFKETAAKLFEVVKMNNQGGILIDPIWFKKFDIKSVPALVINNNDVFDVIYGNIPLKQALSIIAEKSESKEVSEIAKEILKEG